MLGRKLVHRDRVAKAGPSRIRNAGQEPRHGFVCECVRVSAQIRQPGYDREVIPEVLDDVQVEPFADEQERVGDIRHRSPTFPSDGDDVGRVHELGHRRAEPRSGLGDVLPLVAIEAVLELAAPAAGGRVDQVVDQLDEPGPVASDRRGQIELGVVA